MNQVVDNNFICLAEAKSGYLYTIQEITDKALSLKLMEMGCMKGMQILKQSSAPFFGPLLIKILPNGNLMALRFEDAKKIFVNEVS
jgi:Fe2+ transport system protein FeoA